MPYAGLLAQHGVCACLAFGGVGGGDGVDDGLGFFVPDFCGIPVLSAPVPASRSWLRLWELGMRVLLTLIIFHHVSKVVLPAVVGFADAHGVVGEVDIAIVALEALSVWSF